MNFIHSTVTVFYVERIQNYFMRIPVHYTRPKHGEPNNVELGYIIMTILNYLTFCHILVYILSFTKLI